MWSVYMWSLSYLGFDFAEAGDHAIVAVDEHLRFFASGREEHDVGVGVTRGAHGEAPGEVAGAVVDGDALTDGRRHQHGHGHPHLRVG